MSRKHDKSVDDEQSSNLLLTGPIAIRGLGRGVKEALVRGQPSRHRAFATGSTEHDVAPTPLQQMLAGGPTVVEAGPSSGLAAHADAQHAATDDAPIPSTPGPTEAGDDVQEAGMDGPAGEDATENEAAQPAEAPTSTAVAVDDWASPGDDAVADVAALGQPSADPDAPAGTQAEQTPPVDDHRAVVPAPESESFVVEPFDEFDALLVEETAEGAEELSPTPEAVSELPADGAAHAEESVSEPEPASQEDPAEPVADETAEPGDEPNSPLEAEGSAPEDRIELLEAEQADAQGKPSGEQAEVPVPGESESESANEDGREGLFVPESDVIDEAEALSRSEESGLAASEAPASDPSTASLGAQKAALSEPDPDQQVGDEKAEPPSGEHIVAVAASELPQDDTAHQRVEGVEETSDGEAGDAATAGTADEHEPRDEPAAQPEAEPLPVEPADAAAEEQRTNRDPKNDEPTSAEEPQGRGTSDGAPDGRQWVTAEELFGLPLQPGRQDDAGNAALPEAGVPAAEEHFGEPEPDSEPPAEEESMPEPVPAESESGPEPVPVVAESESEAVVAVAAEPEPEPEPELTPEAEQPAPAAEQYVPALAAAAPVALAAARSEPRPAASSGPPRGPRPWRERFGRETIGIAVLVVLALICAGLITAVVIKTRHDAAIAANEAAHYTPPPLATPEPAKTGPVVAVIGDPATMSTAPGVTAKQQWSSVLATSLGGTVSTDTSDGMGYAAKSTSGKTFVQEAGKVPSDAKVVVFFGGAADSNIAPLSLAKAATDAFAAAKQQAPNAKILVVGPAVTSGVSAANLTTIRDTLRSAAAVVKGNWVDPLDRGWLPTAKQTATPAALSASDQSTIASKMQESVKKALG